jgi:hypothetical protein
MAPRILNKQVKQQQTRILYSSRTKQIEDSYRETQLLYVTVSKHYIDAQNLL